MESITLKFVENDEIKCEKFELWREVIEFVPENEVLSNGSPYRSGDVYQIDYDLSIYIPKDIITRCIGDETRVFSLSPDIENGDVYRVDFDDALHYLFEMDYFEDICNIDYEYFERVRHDHFEQCFGGPELNVHVDWDTGYGNYITFYEYDRIYDVEFDNYVYEKYDIQDRNREYDVYGKYNKSTMVLVPHDIDTSVTHYIYPDYPDGTVVLIYIEDVLDALDGRLNEVAKVIPFDWIPAHYYFDEAL